MVEQSAHPTMACNSDTSNKYGRSKSLLFRDAPKKFIMQNNLLADCWCCSAELVLDPDLSHRNTNLLSDTQVIGVYSWVGRHYRRRSGLISNSNVIKGISCDDGVKEASRTR